MTAAVYLKIADVEERNSNVVTGIGLITNWCEEHVGPGGPYDPLYGPNYRWMSTVNYDAGTILYTFKDPRRAVLFKLTWGGV